MGVRHASPGVMGAPPPVMMGASPGGVLRGGYPMATSVGRWDGGGNGGGGVRGPHPAGPGPMSSMGAMGDGSWAPGGTAWTAPGGSGAGGASVDGGVMRGHHQPGLGVMTHHHDARMGHGGGNGMNPPMGSYPVGPIHGLKGFGNGAPGGGVGVSGGNVIIGRGGNLKPSPSNNPDFVVVYTFLAECFDPEVKGHAEKLRSMSPIDRETTTLLMRNLSSNLMCQRMWEDQVQLIGAGCPTFVNATYDEKGVVGVNVPSGAVVHHHGAQVASGNDENSNGDGSGGTAGVTDPLNGGGSGDGSGAPAGGNGLSRALKGSAKNGPEKRPSASAGPNGTGAGGGGTTYVHASEFTRLQPHPVVDVGAWSDQYVGEGPGASYPGGGDADKGFDKGGRTRSNSGSPTEDLIGKGVPEDVYITGGA